MNQEELNKRIEEHGKWFEDHAKGRRLQLSDVALRRLDISNSRLMASAFERVHAYGIVGPAACIEKSFVTEPDLSENGDGSKTRTEEDLLALLRIIPR